MVYNEPLKTSKVNLYVRTLLLAIFYMRSGTN